jgi:hypothetical protein
MFFVWALQACNAVQAPTEPTPQPVAMATRASITEAKASLIGVLAGGEVIVKKLSKAYNNVLDAIGINQIQLPGTRAEAKQLRGIFMALRDGDLSSLNSTALPRGDFNCEDPKACTQLPNADLIVRFRTDEGVLGALNVDWDASSRGEPSETAWFNTSSKTRVELPTKLVLTLDVLGFRFVELELTAKWENPVLNDGGFALALSSVQTKGYARDFKEKLIDVRDLSYEFANTTIKTRGDFELNLSGDQVKLNWRGSVAGTIRPGTTTQPGLFGIISPFNAGLYVPPGFAPTSKTSVLARLELNKRVYETVIELDNWAYTSSEEASLQAVDILEGSFVNLDNRSVLMSGRLDDANRNCIIGDMLNVTGRGESRSLEQLLLGSGMYSCLPEPRRPGTFFVR